MARSTVTHHLRKFGVENFDGYVGRRVVIEILGRSGVRASELSRTALAESPGRKPAP